MYTVTISIAAPWFFWWVHSFNLNNNYFYFVKIETWISEQACEHCMYLFWASPSCSLHQRRVWVDYSPYSTGKTPVDENKFQNEPAEQRSRMRGGHHVLSDAVNSHWWMCFLSPHKLKSLDFIHDLKAFIKKFSALFSSLQSVSQKVFLKTWMWFFRIWGLTILGRVR